MVSLAKTTRQTASTREDSGKNVSPFLCSPDTKPEARIRMRPCAGGLKERRVECKQIMAQEHKVEWPTSMCPSNTPPDKKPCNGKACAPEYQKPPIPGNQLDFHLSTARNCSMSSVNTFTDPTANGDSGDLFRADGLLVEANPLDEPARCATWEIIQIDDPRTLHRSQHLYPGGPAPTSPSTRRTCTNITKKHSCRGAGHKDFGKWSINECISATPPSFLTASTGIHVTGSNIPTAASTPSGNLLPHGHRGRPDQNNRLVRTFTSGCCLSRRRSCYCYRNATFRIPIRETAAATTRHLNSQEWHLSVKENDNTPNGCQSLIAARIAVLIIIIITFVSRKNRVPCFRCLAWQQIG
ncbi:papilin [Culex quinquefasciatus]|uniref:Papilin n=1 Tax=Culex quinquefasciatus TaxID=7176 RepID=B0WQ65_CULQU|nr:papilin [Culex quinquefasciatus]|eukprot:XP_001850849.1 papilin [Culex quinquefasciatus]